ncbi:MAG: HAD hydrolase-like protein, partial [Clostridia bacterium]|nr:HAD hydrolase-like protein [Clostridia bacterium]
IPALLSALRAAGYKLYLATSKPLVFARRVLSDFNIDTYFDGLYGSELDGTRDKKSDVIRYLLQNEKELAAQPLLMIGDRKYDVLGAAELGIPAVGVSYGYGSEGELSDAGAIAVLPTVAALYDYLLKEE